MLLLVFHKPKERLAFQSPCFVSPHRISTKTALSNTAHEVPAPGERDYVDRDSYWTYMYYLLMVYREREGHVDVPFVHTEQGWPLGAWLSDQRVQRKKAALGATYIARLEQAGVAWDLQARHWENTIKLLERFKQREGHVTVPQLHVEGKCNLGAWLNWQRTRYKRGKLEKERQHQLEQLGVAWSVHDAKWDRMYAALLEFVQREGHARVYALHVEGKDKLKLGQWLAIQRKSFRYQSLSEDRTNRLLKAGVVFRVYREREK